MILAYDTALQIDRCVRSVGRAQASDSAVGTGIFGSLIDPSKVLGGSEVPVHPVGCIQIVLIECGVDFAALGLNSFLHCFQVALLVLDLGLNFSCDLAPHAFFGLIGDFTQGLGN